MNKHPVIVNCSYCLAHVPDLVRYGSKPQREIARTPKVEDDIAKALRSYEQVVSYPPNQTFIGNLTPQSLAELPRPWFTMPEGKSGTTSLPQQGMFGEIIDQKSFYALLKLADVINPPLFEMKETAWQSCVAALEKHAVLKDILNGNQNRVFCATGEAGESSSGLPVYNNGDVYGFFHGDQRSEGRDDPNLLGPELLENLSTKASGAVALRWLLHRENLAPSDIDYLISCGEEACGDRYQRGGGGMAKAIGEMCGCVNAAGMDLKNFCAAPVSALITAGALVQSGIYERVVVVGGGSLAKLGMKFQAFLENKIDILDDCLASMAFLVSRDDCKSPIIRFEPGAIGKVSIGAGTSDEAVFRQYLLKPLENMGLRCTDIDKYAPELQNPEIMEFAGSGDVAAKNYRKIAAIAVMSKQLDKSGMDAWINKIGMPGFAPTQGHIPSALPYLGHAMEAMSKKEIKRAMFLGRASLFLNRCTNLLDGASFIMERNPALSK